jgi:hypothetical protein
VRSAWQNLFEERAWHIARVDGDRNAEFGSGGMEESGVTAGLVVHIEARQRCSQRLANRWRRRALTPRFHSFRFLTPL